MIIAYEYSTPTNEQMTRLGWPAGHIQQSISDVSVVAYDGEEPVGFGYVTATDGTGASSCCIQVHPDYAARQIDANIRKLLLVRSMKMKQPQAVCEVS
ncbi:hypothetical protein ACFFK0_03255 [Paenibacillus chartarius]|uniref:N-acetyltransferase domain-containing protein n=1 Tax=Paenibacillus chartarius TaxID=747481 RepID=A0ABV6DFS8_9BACL